jgi:hypothetical protein
MPRLVVIESCGIRVWKSITSVGIDRCTQCVTLDVDLGALSCGRGHGHSIGTSR